MCGLPADNVEGRGGGPEVEKSRATLKLKQWRKIIRKQRTGGLCE